MSTSENISLWKKRAEIDYIPLFISLWLAINAWMRDRYTERNDRDMLEILKRGENTLSESFVGLIQSNDSSGNLFKGNFGKLHRALVNASIPYDRDVNRTVNFANCVIEWNNGNPQFVSVLKEKKPEIENQN